MAICCCCAWSRHATARHRGSGRARRPAERTAAGAGGAARSSIRGPTRYLDVRDAARGMAVTGWSRGEGLFQPTGEPATIALPTMYVSSNYFSTIGVTLPIGPGFSRVDDASRAEPEAVIGHRLWQTRFSGDPASSAAPSPSTRRRSHRRRRAGKVPRPQRRTERQPISCGCRFRGHPQTDGHRDRAPRARRAPGCRIMARLSDGHDRAPGGCDRAVGGGGAGRPLSRHNRTRPAVPNRTLPGARIGRRSRSRG